MKHRSDCIYRAHVKLNVKCICVCRAQVQHYKREQDRKAQRTKQTRELERLPAWPPNSPDLNLIEIVWSWMVQDIAKGGWPKTPEDLMDAVLRAWDNVSLDSFRELVRSYRQRLMAIHSRDGDRHPCCA